MAAGVRWGWVALSLVACGRVGFDAGDGGGAGDRDGDGIHDDDDRCPETADPDQHDEDGDGVGDACDGCPHVPDALGGDADGDGVGDACDPRPTEAGDAIALFWPMTGATLPPGWVGDTGSATVGGDRLTLAADGAAQVLATAASWTPPLTIVTRYRVEVLSGSNHTISIVDAVDLGPPTVAQKCGQSLAAGSLDNELGRVSGGTTVEAVGDPYPDGLMLAVPYVTTLAHDPDGARCVTTVVGGIASAPAMRQPAYGDAGALGLRVRGATVAFDYLVVIGQP
ncbi:MAG: thrombospondin type 3 repeat-containing protein [Kofleriaceae bacterium]